MLWVYDERWYANIQLAIICDIYADVLWRPELVHPFASAIDSELTNPEEMARIFVNLSQCIYHNLLLSLP